MASSSVADAAGGGASGTVADAAGGCFVALFFDVGGKTLVRLDGGASGAVADANDVGRFDKMRRHVAPLTFGSVAILDGGGRYG